MILIFCLHGMLEIFPFEEHRYPAFILLHTGYYTIQYANTFLRDLAVQHDAWLLPSFSSVLLFTPS